jgi:tetratricopeptide (TPR) repeat protein
VDEALQQLPGLWRQGRWSDARATLKKAESRLDDAGSEGLRRQLEQASANLELAARLERVRLKRAIYRDGTFNYKGVDREYAAAFEEAGLDVAGGEETAARIRESAIREELTAALDDWALVTPDDALRSRLLGLARLADPDPVWRDQWRDPANRQNRLALEQRAATAPVAELSPQLLAALGALLRVAGADAEPFLRAAQKRHPGDFWLNFELGSTLTHSKPAQAVRFYGAALVARPDSSEVYDRIGVALANQGLWEEAIAAYRQALALDPKSPAAHSNLGGALLARGQVDEAVAACRRAIELKSDWAPSYYNLGMCLQKKGDFDEAMAKYRRAIQLAPGWSWPHHQLGMCLANKGHFDEAMAEYRRALQLAPKLHPPHYELGAVLRATGRAEEAIAQFREAAGLNPRWALGHEALADLLLRRGRFAEARAAARRGLELLPGNDPHRQALRRMLGQCNELLGLPAGDQLKRARLCRENGLLYAAARLYAAAFAARPALANDLEGRDRYDAACAAARAATGPGPNKVGLGEPERASLRRQALSWLRADLALRAKLVQRGKPAAGALATWWTDAALAGVRDRAALEKLPDDERKQWQRLWADVEALVATDPLEQGRAHAARREWAQAADCYARALKRSPTDDGHFWFEHAAVLLLSGDRQGYTKACARMVERCGKAPGLRAYHVARACTLAPDATAAAARAGRLAQQELKANAQRFSALTQQGALRYRAGRFKEAVPLFERSLRADPKAGRAVLNWLWLALAHHRLGRAEEARRWLGKAQAWLDRYGAGMPSRAEEELGLHLHNWLEAHVLRREAEALLGPGPAKPKGLPSGANGGAAAQPRGGQERQARLGRTFP